MAYMNVKVPELVFEKFDRGDSFDVPELDTKFEVTHRTMYDRPDEGKSFQITIEEVTE